MSNNTSEFKDSGNFQLAKDYIKNFPSLIEFVPGTLKVFETLRNVAHDYSAIRKELPTEQEAEKFKEVIKALEEGQNGKSVEGIREPIPEALKFLSNNGKFKKNHESVGKELLSKDTLTYDEQKLAKQMLKGYEGILEPGLYLEIVNFTPNKPRDEYQDTQGSEIVDIGREIAKELFHDESEEPYAWMKDGAIVRIHSSQFKRMLKAEFYRINGKPAQAEAINQAVDILELDALEGREFRLWLRYAWDSDKKILFMDLGRKDWKVLRIDSEGYALVDQETPMFKRYRGSMELEYDLSGTVEDVRKFINLFKYNDSRDYPTLIIGKIGTDFLPHIGHAIFNATGDPGALKTTFTQALTQIVDPQVQGDHDVPDKREELANLLSHHYGICLDNITGFMQDWKVDMLAKSAKGSYFSKRQLYTDEDEILQVYHNVFNNNGINNPSNRPDYLDREIKALLRRPSNAERLPDVAVRKTLKELFPKVRGAYIKALSRAIPMFEVVQGELTELPRMADFAIHSEAICRAMGIEPMQFIKAYFDSIGKSQLDALDSDIVAELVIELVEETGQWTGTASQLHTLLEAKAQRDKGFPKSANKLTQHLNVLRVDLEAYGIAWIDLKDKKHRKQLKKIVPGDSQPKQSALPAQPAPSLEKTNSTDSKEPAPEPAPDSKQPAPEHDSESHTRKSDGAGRKDMVQVEEKEPAPKKPLKKADGADSADSAGNSGTKDTGEKFLSFDTARKFREVIEKTFSWKVLSVEDDYTKRNFKFRLEGYQSDLPEKLMAMLNTNGFSFVADIKDGPDKGSSWWKLSRELKEGGA